MYRYLVLSILGLLLTGCAKDTAPKAPLKTDYSLRVKIRNITKKPLYATCFSYIKKDKSPRWRWHKSAVHELIPTKETSILIDTYKTQSDIPDAYGILGIFTTYDQARDAIYELTPDENKVDLDRLQKIQGKTIVLGIEKYGVVGDIFDYSFIPDNNTYHEVPELDFTVENKTNKTLYITAFIYQKKDDMPIWRYDKSEIIKIAPNSEGVVDVDTIVNPYDRKYTRGYLAIFDETEKQEAYDSTFQLLKDHQMINLGILSELQDRKIILKNQKYGILGDVIDFVSKEPRKISNLKSENIKYQPRYS